MINNIDDGDIKVYDPKNSKIPIASKVISKERSLIAIFNNGKIVKENLVQSERNHAEATYKSALDEGILLNKACIPQVTEINAAKNGIIIFQIEGKHCFIYFPEFISYKQLESTKQIISELINSIFYYTISNSQQFKEKVPLEEIINQATILSIKQPQNKPNVHK